MIDTLKRILRRIKLVILYFTRIVFVRNRFRVGFFTKVRMNICGGFLADQYVLFDLEHNDRKDYLSEFDWYRSRYINAPFDSVMNNKVVCSEIFGRYIRTPEILFIKNKGILHTMSSGPCTSEDVIAGLKKEGRLFIKPFALGKGRGVSLLRHDGDSFFIDEKAAGMQDVEELLEKRDGYIICECIEQHAYACDLYPHTVNTIRMITLRNPETERFDMSYAVQRIGRSSTIPVDNGSRGGLVARIETDTGILSEARSMHDTDVYRAHPDTGAQIEGVKVPRWEDMKKKVLDVCERVPYMDFIAWDIVVMKDDICMIEANTSSGINILQLWGGLRNEKLGEFFRAHGVIR